MSDTNVETDTPDIISALNHETGQPAGASGTERPMSVYPGGASASKPQAAEPETATGGPIS